MKLTVDWDNWLAAFENRDQAAIGYASMLRHVPHDDPAFKALNEAIIRRWSPSALRYIKTRAWKFAEGRGVSVGGGRRGRA